MFGKGGKPKVDASLIPLRCLPDASRILLHDASFLQVPVSPSRFRHGTQRGSKTESGVGTFFMLENDNKNHGNMLSESVSICIVFRASFYKTSDVRGVFVRMSFFFVVFFGMPDARSARACAVETQFFHFRVTF